MDDRHFGAVLVRAGVDYLEFEARSLNLPSGEEILADRFVLGNPAAVPDKEDEYVFHADAGESVVCRTLNPGGSLVPELTLFDPDGRVSARDAGGDGDGDGRNALLSATLTRSGRWKLGIAAKTEAGGAYQISAQLYRPGEGYGKWSSHLPEGSRHPLADANGDGVPNLVTYAMTPHDGVFTGAAIQINVTPGVNYVLLPVPALMRHDVTLALESSANSAAAVWATEAVRRPFERWLSPSNASLNLFAGSQGRQWLQTVMPAGNTRRFFRLRASLTPAPNGS